ncbi:acetyl-CoA carboxylase biotin carboxylase subunit [Candidatus Acetothermia bacterium]|nr:acetyl-CoA carboxylase biotin carboxylase subunit [Candidatus Acetothermia bacterium]
MLKKVLVANRGEIAIRIFRTCKELGIRTVAVYSEADRGALHTRFADEAFQIGPPPAAESYLQMEKIIGVAKGSNCDGIHPGYGFLSENEDFAQASEDAGLIFVGPSPEAIRLLGDKIAARALAQQNGVPTVPGVGQPIQDLLTAQKAAKEIGFPLLIKAAAGGGGKGMRVVQNESELKDALTRAQSEAQAAFGDPTVFIEKFIPKAKHIEVQILSDAKNFLYLGERECSVQRRHQKLIEESPAPKLTQLLRDTICEAAIKVAKAARYKSAGTVEFLFDTEAQKFYFLEVNTRLQVEHPVTEMVTGIDIVKEQLRVAAGQTLSITQSDVRPRGHAIECRICAEDFQDQFLPSTGFIEELNLPTGPGVRVDQGISQGEHITPFYDPLMAKLIVWGENRVSAIERAKRALEEFRVFGVKTTIGFHHQAMDDALFRSGEYTTDFIKHFQPKRTLTDEELEMLALAAVLKHTQESVPFSTNSDSDASAWKRPDRV